MFGIFPLNYSFLLQDQVKYFKEDNPREVMIILLGIGGIVVISVLFNLIRKGSGASSMGGSKSKSAQRIAPKKFNVFTLFKISSMYGLSRPQSKLLEFVFRNDGVSDPERVMKNTELLDRHFKRAYKTIEKNSVSETEAQQRLSGLFSLRNAIDEASPDDSAAGGAPQLAENSNILLLAGNENYSVKIFYNRGRNIITEVPRNALGTPIRIANGTKVNISYFSKPGKGFSLEGQITGAGNTTKGPGLKIAHSGKVKPLAKRHYRRKQVVIKCELSELRLEEGGGRKRENRLVVDSKKFSGAMQDISIGGCAIKTSAAIQVGSRVKISMVYSRDYVISVLGQVLRINRSGMTGTIMHVKFLKVPIRAYNSINSLVFGYDEDKP